MSVSNLSTDSSDHLPSESLEMASTLTKEQKLRIVENRKEALLRKHRQEMEELDCSKLKASTFPAKCAKTTVTPKLIDTGGGFLLNESEMSINKNVEIPIVNRPPAILPPDQPKCLECDHDFSGSYLLEKFDHPVCDNCRDPKEKHALITKTEAKKNYVLTDVDLEQRGAPLKFILSKNPHNSRWSDMKLYLLLQVEKRALEIWGSEEKLIEELEKKEEKRNKMKQNVYHKKMKALKMSVRSSLYTRSLTESHQHNFDEETYNPTEDTYSRSCFTCSFKETYEKM